MDRTARQVADEKFYTSAGVSAGTDMGLGFIALQYEMEKTKQIAENIKYDWRYYKIQYVKIYIQELHIKYPL